MVSGSDTEIKDETVNGFNATLGGASYGNFASTNAYLEATAPLIPEGDFEIEMQIQGGFGYCLGQYLGGDPGRVAMYVTDRVGIQIGSTITTDAGTISANVWYMIKITRVGSDVSIYIDDALSTTGALAAAVYQGANTTLGGVPAVSLYGSKGISYLRINNCKMHLSVCFGDKGYSEDGSCDWQLFGATLSIFWALDSDSDVIPINFARGFYLYENGTSGEEIRTPYQLEAGDIPIGYTLTRYVPPLVFGPWEGFFKAPDEAVLKAADINNFLYDGGGIAKEISYATLVAGGGDPGMDTNIQYDQNTNGDFVNFRVRDVSEWILLDEFGDPILDESGSPIVSF